MDNLKLNSTGSGEHTVSAYTAFYDKGGAPIIDTANADRITGVLTLGNVSVSHADVRIHFGYERGSNDQEGHIGSLTAMTDRGD